MKEEIFIVPDNDLEARTIQNFLEKNGWKLNKDYFVTKQKDPSWENLEPEIKAKVKDLYDNDKIFYNNKNNSLEHTTKFYGINLKGETFDGFKNINYYRDKEENGKILSSLLERVSNVIHAQLSNEEQLVSANAKGYIKEIEKTFYRQYDETKNREVLYEKYLLKEMKERGYKINEVEITQEGFDVAIYSIFAAKSDLIDKKSATFKNLEFDKLTEKENELLKKLNTKDSNSINEYIDMKIITPDNKTINYSGEKQILKSEGWNNKYYFNLNSLMETCGEKNVMTFNEFSQQELDNKIKEIRLKEREIKGVTPEQEKQAEEAIKNTKTLDNGLKIVECEHSKCDPIIDRLHGTYESLLIISKNGEYNFFGKSEICNQLKRRYGGDIEDTKDQKTSWEGKPLNKENKEAVIKYLSGKINLNKIFERSEKDEQNEQSQSKQNGKWFESVKDIFKR